MAGRLVAALAMALVAASCSYASPTPTPGDMTALMAELSAHGITVVDNVAGDTGCDEPSLRDNASRLTVRLTGEATDATVYLFRWRRTADFSAATDSFQACLAVFAQAAGRSPASVELSPWRAYGLAWSGALQAALGDSLAGAGGR